MSSSFPPRVLRLRPFNGAAFANVPAPELGAAAITAALNRAQVRPGEVSELIFGQVLTANQGMNPGRQATLKACIPVEAPAWLVNQVCGSGLRSVAVAAQSIKAGDASIVIAGGQESMSLCPHAQHLAQWHKDGLGRIRRLDDQGRIVGRLQQVPHGHHGRERGAREFQISRETQDRFAVASQNKAEAARKEGRFKDEIAPVTVKERKGERIVDTDEYIRDGVTYESISGLRPAFCERRLGHGGKCLRHQ